MEELKQLLYDEVLKVLNYAKQGEINPKALKYDTDAIVEKIFNRAKES